MLLHDGFFVLNRRLAAVVDKLLKVDTDDLLKLDIVDAADNIDGLTVPTGTTGERRGDVRTRSAIDSVCDLVFFINLFLVLLRLFNRDRKSVV